MNNDTWLLEIQAENREMKEWLAAARETINGLAKMVTPLQTENARLKQLVKDIHCVYIRGGNGLNYEQWRVLTVSTRVDMNAIVSGEIQG